MDWPVGRPLFRPRSKGATGKIVLRCVTGDAEPTILYVDYVNLDWHSDARRMAAALSRPRECGLVQISEADTAASAPLRSFLGWPRRACLSSFQAKIAWIKQRGSADDRQRRNSLRRTAITHQAPLCQFCNSSGFSTIDTR